MFFGLLQKDLFLRKMKFEAIFLKQNYCHACHTRFASLLCSLVLLRKFTIIDRVRHLDSDLE